MNKVVFFSSSTKSVVTNALVLPFLTREDMFTQVRQDDQDKTINNDIDDDDDDDDDDDKINQ